MGGFMRFLPKSLLTKCKGITFSHFGSGLQLVLWPIDHLVAVHLAWWIREGRNELSITSLEPLGVNTEHSSQARLSVVVWENCDMCGAVCKLRCKEPSKSQLDNYILIVLILKHCLLPNEIYADVILGLIEAVFSYGRKSYYPFIIIHSSASCSCSKNYLFNWKRGVNT